MTVWHYSNEIVWEIIQQFCCEDVDVRLRRGKLRKIARRIFANDSSNARRNPWGECGRLQTGQRRRDINESIRKVGQKLRVMTCEIRKNVSCENCATSPQLNDMDGAVGWAGRSYSIRNGMRQVRGEELYRRHPAMRGLRINTCDIVLVGFAIWD